MERTEVRVNIQTKHCFPEMPCFMRVGIEAGVAGEQPSREEVDREREAVHLDEQGHNECRETAERPPVAGRLRMRETEGEDEEDRDIDGHESPQAVCGCCVSHGDGGKKTKTIFSLWSFHHR